ncbi:MAG: protein kinase domain-containing protein [Planctomycetota bacterium]
MTLSAGQALSHYEILGPLGAGAMGEVYRARDTRLEREVAIKVLPLELAGDEQRLRRFEREAKTLASLNHSNVAQVFGIDQVNDTCFMAMELVPGEDLAARLARGALPVAEALDVCAQIAEGVEAAHEAGVIHRDLKPANVVITRAGKVKVLDFGLAKPAEPDGASPSTVDSVLVTEEGRVLGTPTYMAPEQARGQPIDKRVDVWAFGCVLYECLAGRRAFDGGTIGDVIASVLQSEPDWQALPATTPGRLRELLERCLRKDPRRRLRDIGDARIALADMASSGGALVAGAEGGTVTGTAAGAGTAAGTGTTPGARGRPALTAGAVVLAAVLGYLATGTQGSADPAPRYVSVPLASSNSYRTNPSWSPEGEWIAFGRMETGSEDLYLRHVSSGKETLRRAGPGDDSGPAWSPDGQHIAFVASGLPGTPVLYAPPYSEGGERELTRTNIRVFDSGSYSQALGDRPWSRDSSSLLVSRVTDGQIAVWRVGLHDGSEEQLTSPPSGSDDLAASYSFAWDRIVFVRSSAGSSSLMLMPADGGPPVELIDGPDLVEPAWHPDGERIVYDSTEGGSRNLWQVDVADPTRRRQLTDLVGMWPGGHSVSSNGRIAYALSWHDTILTTLDLETGEEVALTDHALNNFGPRFSPDGRSIAYASDRMGDNEIWVHDLGGEEHRITQVAGADVHPDWSPDGERLVFISDRTGAMKVYVANRDGSDCHALEHDALLATDPDGGRDSMSARWSPSSPSGELIGFIVTSDEGKTLWGIPPDGGPARELLEDVVSFDWYMDSRRVVCTLDEGRAEKLVVVDLETGETNTLWEGAHAEIDVAPDGSAVMFCRGLGHLNMGLATLELVPPEDPGGLPTARGEPVDIVRPEGRWHVHHGGWAPDSKSVVYVHDADRANIYELVEQL